MGKLYMLKIREDGYVIFLPVWIIATALAMVPLFAGTRQAAITGLYIFIYITLAAFSSSLYIYYRLVKEDNGAGEAWYTDRDVLDWTVTSIIPVLYISLLAYVHVGGAAVLLLTTYCLVELVVIYVDLTRKDRIVDGEVIEVQVSRVNKK